MAYHIHQTEAIVLDTYDLHDASKSLLVYTRQLGLLYVRAQGLRRLESKLRFGLQTLSVAHIGVVKGKAGWRLVDATPVRAHTRLLFDVKRRAIVLNVVRLLRRLLDEGAHDEVYELLETMLHTLDSKVGEQYASIVESITVLLILHELGYVAEVPDDIDGAMITDETRLNDSLGRHAYFTRQINTALQETQL